MKKYKGIIFDLDGTMLNTEKMNIVPLQRLIKEELGQDVHYEKLLKYMAYAGKKTLELLEFKDIKKSYTKWVKYVNEYEEGAQLYDGFKGVIEALHKNNILCGIASSKMKKQYEIDFLKTNLHNYMSGVVLAEDTEKHKPYPDPLLKAAETLEVEPKDVLYVGDTIVDFKAAKAAGMDFALASWGNFDISGIKADYELKKPIDILKIVGVQAI
ncbi:HAD family hydrolase [Clostridium tarantellae]|uniref:HAD-IA family hydrolase n=1 Tax=Clostridium tarantellae TaxID=39493 RepID=A0A6I1MHC6_9CLOT|nr:HAD-IA family hydrolase [Clostridium tarantellae]MPQ42936.1 HAD-IA family hydrolase [Clostridium tarantellae]